MAASRPVLLPLLLAACALFGALSFCGGAAPVTGAALRGNTARAAVPEAMALESSLTTALAVSTPGWWANIVGVMVPLTFLIVLYLQSERTISQEAK
mmetsp:Transcript_86709/g.187570  ORF Transcript_86709/g.187570 Transcript_86709/m.187570 type:complete len:97 (+) Transcript_86709:58-348(+)